MTTNLITRYLEYKKKHLTSYTLSLFTDKEYKNYEIECLKKYIDNYVEVFYHQRFETLGNGVKPDQNTIEIEQEGMRLELLEALQAREIIESNSSYTRKKEIIEETKEYAKAVITFDQKKVVEEKIEEVITDITINVSKKFPVLQNAITTWIKKYKEEQKIIKKLLEENKTFVLNQAPYQENLWELTLLTNIKQLNTYKHSLVKRVEVDQKVEVEKLKVIAMIVNQIILGQIIRKESIGNYIIPVKEEIWQEKTDIEEVLNLLNDKILKEHIYLGVSYNILSNSKKLQEKKQEGYRFACYQDFTHILDIPTKISTIDTSNLFSYLVVTGCKAKDVSTIEKEEPSIIKQIFFRKDR